MYNSTIYRHAIIDRHTLVSCCDAGLPYDGSKYGCACAEARAVAGRYRTLCCNAPTMDNLTCTDCGEDIW